MRVMCGEELKGRKRANDFILMFGLIEAIDQLAMSWYGHFMFLFVSWEGR